MSIPFTQYHLPNGRRTTESYDPGSPAIQALADKIIAVGGRFEAEILRTGQVSLTVAAPLPDPTTPGETFDGDIAIIICRNELGFLNRAIESLVAQAAKKLGIK